MLNRLKFNSSGFVMILILSGLHLMIPFQVKSQFLIPADSIDKERKWLILGTALGTYSIGFATLGQTWYKDNFGNGFHFFNDNQEWLQMDKAGHIWSSYNEANLAYKAYRWTGTSEKNAIWFGLCYGFIFQSTIEVFDGFSKKWGFSYGDILANNIGLAMFGLQQYFWKEQRFSLKVSSDFRRYSPINVPSTDGKSYDMITRRTSSLFGDHWASRFLKDYNAQTIWLSINPASFRGKCCGWWPSYLNIALGYSGEGMYGGFENSWVYEGQEYVYNEKRYRQLLLSLDLDLTKIPVKSPFLKTLFSCINMIKIPAPCIEVNPVDKVKWHWIYF